MPARSKTYTAVSWVLVACMAGFIFFMSAHTSNELGEGFFEEVREALAGVLNALFGYHEDPVSPFCHFNEYLLFGVLLANALHSHMGWPAACLLALAIASGYGVTDEFHQSFVPGRTVDVLDWATDTCGAALGVAIVAAVQAARGTLSAGKPKGGARA